MNYSGCSQLNFRWAVQEEEPVVTDDPRRLIIRTCRHLKDSGCFCQAAAVAGRPYCRAHLSLRARRRTMARARRRASRFKLPLLLDLQAVEAGAVRIRVALAADHIDIGRARLMLWAMRQVAADIRFTERQEELSQVSATGCDQCAAARDKPNQHYQIAINYSDSRTYRQNTS